MTEPHVPTTQEELSRKTLETIEELLLWRSQERITDGQLGIAINAVFKSVSGLIDKDVFEIISQIVVDHPKHDREIAVFQKGRGSLVLVRYVNQGRLMAWDCLLGKTSAKSFEDEALPDKRAKQAFDAAIQHCRDKGYRELTATK